MVMGSIELGTRLRVPLFYPKLITVVLCLTQILSTTGCENSIKSEYCMDFVYSSYKTLRFVGGTKSELLEGSDYSFTEDNKYFFSLYKSIINHKFVKDL